MYSLHLRARDDDYNGEDAIWWWFSHPTSNLQVKIIDYTGEDAAAADYGKVMIVMMIS